MRPLVFEDLDLSLVPKALLSDVKWRWCISLALKSRSEDQRYGAVVYEPFTLSVYGRGYNRRLGKGEPCPFRTSFFLHAEADALRAALLHGMERLSRPCNIAVAGFMVKTRRPFIRRRTKLHEGSCAKCARLYVQYGLTPTLITEDGWVELSATTVLENAERTLARLRREGTSLREHRARIAL